MNYIYKITNKINGKCYIGKTSNIADRWRTHKNLGYGKEPNKALYLAMQKYGPDNFEYSIIEECKDNWQEREKYWISYYNSYKNGYNMDLGGGKPPHPSGEDHPLSKLTWNDIYNIIEEIKTTNKTFKDISIKYNICIDQIFRINSGKSWHIEGESYPIRKIKKLSEEDVLNIYNLLQEGIKTQKEIGNMYNLSRTAITAINQGTNYHHENIDYPIRKKPIRYKK